MIDVRATIVALLVVTCAASFARGQRSIEDRLKQLSRLDFASREGMVEAVNQFEADAIIQLVAIAEDDSSTIRVVARYLLRRCFDAVATTLVEAHNGGARGEPIEQALYDLTALLEEMLPFHRDWERPRTQNELLGEIGAADLALRQLLPHTCPTAKHTRPCPHDPLIVKTLWAAGQKEVAIERAWTLLEKDRYAGGRGYGYDGYEQAEQILKNLVEFAAQSRSIGQLRARAARQDQQQANHWMQQIVNLCDIHIAFGNREYLKLGEMLRGRESSSWPGEKETIIRGFRGSGDDAVRPLLACLRKTVRVEKNDNPDNLFDSGPTRRKVDRIWQRNLLEALGHTGSELAIRPLQQFSAVPFELGKKFPRASLLAWLAAARTKKPHYTDEARGVASLRHPDSTIYLIRMLGDVPRDSADPHGELAAKAAVIHRELFWLTGESLGMASWDGSRIRREGYAVWKARRSAEPELKIRPDGYWSANAAEQLVASARFSAIRDGPDLATREMLELLRIEHPWLLRVLDGEIAELQGFRRLIANQFLPYEPEQCLQVLFEKPSDVDSQTIAVLRVVTQRPIGELGTWSEWWSANQGKVKPITADRWWSLEAN